MRSPNAGGRWRLRPRRCAGRPGLHRRPGHRGRRPGRHRRRGDATPCSNSSAMSAMCTTTSLIRNACGGLLLQIREIGQRLRHILVSDEQRGPGQFLVLRCPIGQTRGDLDAAGRLAASPKARSACAVRMRPCAAAPMMPGTRRGIHSPATAAMGRSANSVSKRADHAGKLSASRAPSATQPRSMASLPEAAPDRGGAVRLRPRADGVRWPSCANTSAPIGPWFDRPNGPNSGAVAANESAHRRGDRTPWTQYVDESRSGASRRFISRTGRGDSLTVAVLVLRSMPVEEGDEMVRHCVGMRHDADMSRTGDLAVLAPRDDRGGLTGLLRRGVHVVLEGEDEARHR